MSLFLHFSSTYKHQNLQFYSCLYSEGFWEVCSYMISLFFHCTLSKSVGSRVFSLSTGACDVKSHSLVSKRRGELTVLAAVFVISVDERYSRVAPLVRAQALHGHEHAVAHAAWMPRNHSLLLRLQRSNHRLRFHWHWLLCLHGDISRWCTSLQGSASMATTSSMSPLVIASTGTATGISAASCC